MALGATLYNVDVDLADADRSVYDSLALRVARHPSESDEYLIARVLAYCLEYTDGIEFSKGGLSEPDNPPIAVRDLTGTMTAWIDIGSPDAARLHKASKASPRVVVYTHKDAARLVQQLSGERIHKAESIEIRAIDRALLDALVARLDRRTAWELAVSAGHLYLTAGGVALDGAVVGQSLVSSGR